MKQNIFYSFLAVFLLISAFYAWSSQTSGVIEKEVEVFDYKNIEYKINGENIKLEDGFSEIEIASSSASKIVTRYFGDELNKDLNNDEKEDVVFVITQDGGGSGTFYYVVFALKTEDGYSGSEGYFIGDRIIPKNIISSEENSIIVNFLERQVEESFDVEPSVEKSVYLYPKSLSMRFVEVKEEKKGVEGSKKQ